MLAHSTFLSIQQTNMRHIIKTCVINNGADQPAVLSSLVNMDDRWYDEEDGNGADQPYILSSLFSMMV